MALCHSIQYKNSYSFDEFSPWSNSQNKKFSKNCHRQINLIIFHFLSKITTAQEPKYQKPKIYLLSLPLLQKISQSNFPSISIVTSNFNSIFLKVENADSNANLLYYKVPKFSAKRYDQFKDFCSI